jgi:hypothetical protein
VSEPTKPVVEPETSQEHTEMNDADLENISGGAIDSYIYIAPPPPPPKP